MKINLLAGIHFLLYEAKCLFLFIEICTFDCTGYHETYLQTPANKYKQDGAEQCKAHHVKILMKSIPIKMDSVLNNVVLRRK
jgi:hypothetical protein